jgi:hypothetical protein
MTTDVFRTDKVTDDELQNVVDEIIACSWGPEDARTHFSVRNDVVIPEPINSSKDVFDVLPDQQTHILIIDKENVDCEGAIVFAPWLAIRDKITLLHDVEGRAIYELQDHSSKEEEEWFSSLDSDVRQEFLAYRYENDGLFWESVREIDTNEGCIYSRGNFYYDAYDQYLPKNYLSRWTYGKRR